MTAAPHLHAVAPDEPAPAPATKPTQLQRTRALAQALAAEDRALAQLAEARARVDAAFVPWAAGRSISRDQAREQLASTGHLEPRTVWE